MYRFPAPPEDSVDYKNREKIYKLIKNHFSYTIQSLEFIKEQLFTPLIDDKLAKIVDYDPSLRKRFPINDSLREQLDAGWELFKEYFPDFSSKYDVNYNNFLRNKITIDKNEFKLKKALINFYIGMNKEERQNAYLRRAYVFTSSDFFDFYGNNSSDDEVINKKVEHNIESLYNEIGARSIPKNSNNIELVFTLNFADWFTSSTENGWGSCLGLNSDYEGAYWSGLPGLLGDPNRAMLYLSVGKTKEPFGIKCGKFKMRSWLILDDNDFMQIVQWYPKTMIRFSEIEKIVKDSIDIETGDNEYHSKYPITPLWTVGGYANFIYQDTTTTDDDYYLINDNNDAGYFIFTKHETQPFSEDIYSYNHGLKNLISYGKEIEDYSVRNMSYCSNCDEQYPDDEMEYVNGRFLCHNCSDELITCAISGVRDFEESFIYIESEDIYVHENIVDDYYVKVEDHFGFYRKEDCVYVRNSGYYFKNFVRESTDFIFSKEDQVWYLTDEAIYIRQNDDYVGLLTAMNKYNMRQCAETKHYYKLDEMLHFSDGRYFSIEGYKKYMEKMKENVA